MKDKVFPIAPSDQRFAPKGAHHMVRATGEKRPPRPGEWYVSGAIPEGYHTKGTMTGSYWIAKLVRVESIRRVVEVE